MFGNAHYYLGKKIINKCPYALSKSQAKAFLAGEALADIGRFYLDEYTEIETDSFEFVNKMKEVAETDEEKYFALGFESHVFQDNETKKVLKNIFGSDDDREYIFKCAGLDKYCSKQINGIFYNKCLKKFKFNNVALMLKKSGFDIDVLSKKYDIPPKLLKIFIRIVLKKKSLFCNRVILNTYGNLIKRTYKSLNFEISKNEINKQIGNLLGVFIVASHLDKTEISEELAFKIERNFDEIADFCASELGKTK